MSAERSNAAETPGAAGAGLPATTITRRIEWADTDAAGIYHWTTVMRLAEAAEAVLHTELGVVGQTFGRTPRVHAEFDFKRSLRFNDEVQVTLAIVKVGRSSLSQTVEIRHDGELCANGKIVTCCVNPETRSAVPWPDELRARLGSVSAPS